MDSSFATGQSLYKVQPLKENLKLFTGKNIPRSDLRHTTFCWIAGSQTEFDTIQSTLKDSQNFELIDYDLDAATPLSLRRLETIKQVFGDEFPFNSGLSEALRTLVDGVILAAQEKSAGLTASSVKSVTEHFGEISKMAVDLEAYLTLTGDFKLKPDELVETVAGIVLGPGNDIEKLGIDRTICAHLTWTDLDENIRAIIQTQEYLWNAIHEKRYHNGLPYLALLPKALDLSDVQNQLKQRALGAWLRQLRKHYCRLLLQVARPEALEAVETLILENGPLIVHSAGKPQGVVTMAVEEPR